MITLTTNSHSSHIFLVGMYVLLYILSKERASIGSLVSSCSRPFFFLFFYLSRMVLYNLLCSILASSCHETGTTPV